MATERALRWIIAALSVSFIFFHFYTAAFGVFIAQLQRSVHFTFAAVIGFLFLPAIKGKKVGIPEFVMALLSALCFGYIVYNCNEIALRQSLVTPLSTLDLIIGGIGILLILELNRRAIGWPLSAVAALSLAYAFIGPYLPMVIAHRGFSLIDVIDYQSYGLDGIYGLPLGISSTYIILFIILGTFLEFTGVGDFIMDLGKLLAGHTRGGAAKIAVISSAFFGSISGSAVANVYATGSLTIPMMKRIGYKSHIAGAVEAVASTGGQIMPPVMGAAAFLMAELLGIPYIQVCKAALLPALLYFATLLFVLDFEAAKTGIKGLKREELPSYREVIPRLYLLLPIVFLVIVLLQGYTAFRAAFIAILIALGLSFIKKGTRFTPKTFLEALVTSARRGAMIAAAVATAGIVIGIVTLTGIGLSFSSVVISLSGGNLMVGLLLIMIASIIMGLGTPTTVAYIIVVTLAAPAMKEFGFAPLPSHMFVFYFGVLSMISPPVAVSAYAAADIAEADAMRIGFAAVRIGFLAFIVPFVFIFEPALFMEGSWWFISLRFAMTLAGVLILAGAISGWFFQPLNRSLRLLCFITSLLIITPVIQTNLIGIILALILILFVTYRYRIRISEEKI